MALLLFLRRARALVCRVTASTRLSAQRRIGVTHVVLEGHGRRRWSMARVDYNYVIIKTATVTPLEHNKLAHRLARA